MRSRLAVGAPVVADLQHCIVPGRGQRVPGVRAVRRPGHEQVVARAPKQQVAALGLLQRLRAATPKAFGGSFSSPALPRGSAGQLEQTLLWVPPSV